jgi:Putative Ig domain
VTTKANTQDALTYSIAGLPPGATISPTATYGKALLTWTLGNYPVTITVTDSGNGTADTLSNTLAFTLVVRSTNLAPVLGTIGNRTVAEDGTLTFQLNGSDANGDRLSYQGSNLPNGAQLNPKTGVFTWTPTVGTVGNYDLQFTTTDGNQSSSENVKITVTHTNHAPWLTPLPLQRGSETKQLIFNVIGNDIDGDGLIYTIDGVQRDGVALPIPQGVYLNQTSGKFVWTPNYDQAGDYVFTFAAIDPYGQRDSKNIRVLIDNVNRKPSLKISDRGTVIGQEVRFVLPAQDPDIGTTLTYQAIGLPAGATFNSQTGEFRWVPTAGQLGDYPISFSVSDGELVVQQTATVKVLNQLQPPQVLLEVTPSFPVLPGQKTIISVLANSIADIATIQVKVDGVLVDTFKYNGFRNGGDLTFSSAQTGRHEVEVLVTDLDGLTTKTTHVVKVKDPLDTAAPVVAFDSGLNGARLTATTEILAKVVDSNLDEWQLEIGESGTTNYRVMSSGYATTNNLAALATLDPQTLVNGFYRLKLTARDISGRTSVSQAIVEVNTATKSSFTRQETDLTLTLGGMPIALTRQYNASTGQWTFGYDPHLQVNVAENAPLTVGVVHLRKG